MFVFSSVQIDLAAHPAFSSRGIRGALPWEKSDREKADDN
jgi:hypothetical protein